MAAEHPAHSVSVVRYRALRDRGVPRRAIDAAVRSARLLRIRNGTFLPADAPEPAVAACQAGGRLDCVSLLRHLGVFVLETTALHVQMDRSSTRVPPRTGTIVRHWRTCAAGRDDVFVDVVGALAQACRCQDPRAAVATLDSALCSGVIDEGELERVFDLLPARFATLRPLIDRRAESGPETLLRLLLRARGWSFDLQVRIPGVGRVDFVIDGWLIIECDSAAHHSSWDERRRDLRRDLAAAALGFTTLRALAEDIMWNPTGVVEGIAGLIEARRLAAGVHDVGRRRRRAPRGSAGH